MIKSYGTLLLKQNMYRDYLSFIATQGQYVCSFEG